MKIQHKIIFILFLFFMIISIDNICHASIDVTIDNVNVSLPDLPSNLSDYINTTEFDNIIYNFVLDFSSVSYGWGGSSCTAHCFPKSAGNVYYSDIDGGFRLQTLEECAFYIIFTCNFRNQGQETTDWSCLQAFYTYDFAFDVCFYSNVNYVFFNCDLYDRNSYEHLFNPNVGDSSIYPYNETVTLYIDDLNFKKRFRFTFPIPIDKEDTKYFCFLKKYQRLDYNSIYAEFVIYTVSTPADYDFTDYENYLYYDKLSDKLYFPAGCTIKEYTCNMYNNATGELSLQNTFVAERKTKMFHSSNFIQGVLNQTTELQMLNNNDLIPTSVYLSHYDYYEVLTAWVDIVASLIDADIGVRDVLNEFNYTDIDELSYKEFLYCYFYNKDFLEYTMNDLSFGNNCIVSYENPERVLNKDNFYIYNFLRKTKVYNKDNFIRDNIYCFNYSDGQDVSSMLPSGTDTDYLTSPLYKNNDNSVSGGFISYDYRELLNNNPSTVIIDYSKESSPIRQPITNTYITNFEEGDNITINNYYTNVIDNTSIENYLHNIYITLLEIQSMLSNMGDNITYQTNNIDNSVTNNVKKIFVPSSYKLREQTDAYKRELEQHLGLLYEPLSFVVYTVTLFSRMDNTTEIYIDIPQITYKDVQLIPATNFSFTQYMQDLPILYTIHQTYLTAVDFVILGLIIAYAVKVGKEVLFR